ncbi:MAG TPA: hypothetical protein VN445_14840, partial [Rectinemataceae bacterium]|nr:hypothetical protein [Rectinemataceae bacterium]
MNRLKQYAQSAFAKRLRPDSRLRSCLLAVFLLTLGLASYGQGHDPDALLEATTVAAIAAIATTTTTTT